MSVTVYRQGDVLLIPVVNDDTLLAHATRQGSRLIRRGEHGGLHTLEAQLTRPESERAYIMVRPSGAKVVLAPHGGAIVHGEHNRLAFPAGTYRVRIQREGRSDTQFRTVVD